MPNIPPTATVTPSLLNLECTGRYKLPTRTQTFLFSIILQYLRAANSETVRVLILGHSFGKSLEVKRKSGPGILL